MTIAPAAPVTLASGGTLSLAAVIANKKGETLTEPALKWTSSNEAVATVGSQGLVTAFRAGLTNVTASAGTVVSAPVAITVSPGVPARLAMKSSAGSAQSGSLLAPQPVIEIQDAAGNATTASSTVTVALTQGGGVLSGTLTVTAVNGVATFTDLKVRGAPGDRRLTFSSPGLASVVSPAMPISLDPTPAFVTISPATTQALAFGGTRQLTAALRNADSASVAGVITWDVRNSDIATVSTSGLVTALKVGTTKLVAKALGITSDSLTIIVDPRVEYGVASAKILRLAAAQQVTPAVSAFDASGPVTGLTFAFESRATAVAPVDGAGTITGASAGAAFVVGSTVAGGGTDSVYVQVVPNTGPVLRTDLSQMNYKAGDIVTVKVVLDTRGALVGAATFSLTWPTDGFIGFLDLIDVVDGAAALGTITETAVNGQVRANFVAANGVTGAPEVLRLRFSVRAVPPGRTGWIILLAQDIVGTDFVSITSSVTPLRYPLQVAP